MSADPGRSMMLSLADEIQSSVSARLFHVALLTALTVPDICGALDSVNGRSSKASYARWFDRWVAPEYSRSGCQYMTGDDCYKCRCRLLHQGRTTGKGRYAQYVFLSEKQDGVADFGVLRLDSGQKLLVEVPVFCRHVICAIHDWLEVVENTPRFKKNTAEAVTMLRLSFKF